MLKRQMLLLCELNQNRYPDQGLNEYANCALFYIVGSKMKINQKLANRLYHQYHLLNHDCSDQYGLK